MREHSGEECPAFQFIRLETFCHLPFNPIQAYRNRMMLFTRSCLILCLCITLVAPKATAVVAWMMPNSFQNILICTGSSVVLITLDATGTPIGDTEIVIDHCNIGEANITVASYFPHWVQASFDIYRIDALIRTPHAGLPPELRKRQSRAPPLV